MKSAFQVANKDNNVIIAFNLVKLFLSLETIVEVFSALPVEKPKQNSSAIVVECGKKTFEDSKYFDLDINRKFLTPAACIMIVIRF